MTVKYRNKKGKAENVAATAWGIANSYLNAIQFREAGTIP